MRSLHIFFLFLLPLLIIACGSDDDTNSNQNGFTIGSRQNQNQSSQSFIGRKPPPISPGDTTKQTANNAQNGTINPVHRDVAFIRVWLKRVAEFKIQVIAEVAPVEDTHVLLGFFYWGGAEDKEPFERKLIPVTVHKNTKISEFTVSIEWPWATTQIMILPLETLTALALPLATAELNTIKEGHTFMPYQVIEGYETVVIPPLVE